MQQFAQRAPTGGKREDPQRKQWDVVRNRRKQRNAQRNRPEQIHAVARLPNIPRHSPMRKHIVWQMRQKVGDAVAQNRVPLWRKVSTS